MGKQINYYMEYESFLLLAEKALELGCEIISAEHARELRHGFSTDIITPEHIFYYFHVPEAGAYQICTDLNGNQYADNLRAGGNSLIEAGFSFVSADEKTISRNRLYSSTGYYDADKVWIARPDCVTKVYQALARYAKKLAPASEITEKQISMQDDTYLQETERISRHYITAYCLNLRQEGYRLR